jgi:hypothetical protein
MTFVGLLTNGFSQGAEVSRSGISTELSLPGARGLHVKCVTINPQRHITAAGLLPLSGAGV